MMRTGGLENQNYQVTAWAVKDFHKADVTSILLQTVSQEFQDEETKEFSDEPGVRN